MSSEPIICFNGKECCYNIDVECPHYEGDAQSGVCNAPREPVKKSTGRNIPAPSKLVEPVPQSDSGGARFINTLKEGETGNKANPIKLKGVLVFDPIQKNVDTSYGTKTVTSIVLKDDTGECKISFWGKAGDEITDFQKGDKLFFEGLYKVKSPYDGKPQVDGGKYYKVAKLN